MSKPPKHRSNKGKTIKPYSGSFLISKNLPKKVSSLVNTVNNVQQQLPSINSAPSHKKKKPTVNGTFDASAVRNILGDTTPKVGPAFGNPTGPVFVPPIPAGRNPYPNPNVPLESFKDGQINPGDNPFDKKNWLQMNQIANDLAPLKDNPFAVASLLGGEIPSNQRAPPIIMGNGTVGPPPVPPQPQLPEQQQQDTGDETVNSLEQAGSTVEQVTCH